jgi:hypothetical protein
MDGDGEFGERSGIRMPNVNPDPLGLPVTRFL